MLKYNEKYIVEQYNKGKSTKAIASELKTYNTTIRRILIRNNIKLRNQTESQRKVSNPFNNLEDISTQYWLGMLASDGTIGDKEYSVTLGLQERDLNHLQKYAQFIGIPIYKILNKRFNVFEYRAAFKSKECNLYLRSLGITPRKSKTLYIDFNITPDFIRGVIDGDGYIRKDRGTIEIATQSFRFKNQLIEWFTKNNIKPSMHMSNDLFIVGIYSKKDLFSCYNLIYKNASIYLERKYDRLYASLFGNN